VTRCVRWPCIPRKIDREAYDTLGVSGGVSPRGLPRSTRSGRTPRLRSDRSGDRRGVDALAMGSVQKLVGSRGDCDSCIWTADGFDEATKDYRNTYQELTGLSLCQCPACQVGHMGAVPRPSVDHAASIDHRHVMTTEQPSRFRAALKCLFHQATGKPSQIASNLPPSPCYSRLDAVCSLGPPTQRSAFAPAFTGGPAAAARLATPPHPLGTPGFIGIPIAPAPCERLSPTAF
jgi:hypothetical protein